MLELSAKLRRETGVKNKQLRKQGFVPAVLYGHKVKNLLLSVGYYDFKRIYKEAGESSLVKLKIKNGQDKKRERVVLIQDVAKDPISNNVIHVDFNQIKMDEKIKIEVPLAFIGESSAVETEGGVLIKNYQNIEIEVLPQNLPHQIEVDISVLKTFEDNIYIKDLKPPEGVEIKENLDDVVASVAPPRTKAELEELEEAPIEAVEEVEVEEKGKIKEAEEEPAEEPAKEEVPLEKKENE